ncbi:unnamed protein product [Paramecium sonneborni]|uniref:Uncharacterized protein n=1 Tax=Paramecium sonneborni TaxID=65129 RepID=A0A8S1RRL2_9CILI|nr:unnamed protein product [Paramecium sonneborni]
MKIVLIITPSVDSKKFCQLVLIKHSVVIMLLKENNTEKKYLLQSLKVQIQFHLQLSIRRQQFLIILIIELSMVLNATGPCLSLSCYQNTTANSDSECQSYQNGCLTREVG